MGLEEEARELLERQRLATGKYEREMAEARKRHAEEVAQSRGRVREFVALAKRFGVRTVKLYEPWTFEDHQAGRYPNQPRFVADVWVVRTSEKVGWDHVDEPGIAVDAHGNGYLIRAPGGRCERVDSYLFGTEDRSLLTRAAGEIIAGRPIAP